MKKREKTLFDFMDHQDKLGNYKDPLKTLDEHIDWEGFRELIKSGFATIDYSKGGRPPYDKLMLFKILVLQNLYGLLMPRPSFRS
ncbi:hypothetical protein [Arcticibacter svalbardensis]|uniref:hypothetical protein n=1 Tax=Arcticibacter svalbardensis TaxID=1288027 RepID=UPI00058C0EE0|nr:hypothetical protein [Arcticibacter svalbardensis]